MQNTETHTNLIPLTMVQIIEYIYDGFSSYLNKDYPEVLEEWKFYIEKGQPIISESLKTLVQYF